MSHMTEQIGRVVGGRYRLLAPLGSGASAEVYLADDVRLRRRVAVKLLHAGLADDEAFLRRFRTEARSAAALSHANILGIFDWNGDESPPYLVTEYLSGGSLRSMLDRGVRLSPSQALLIGLETAQALDHAHRQGFVHRDIKPANLLFGADGRLRVADFGLARAVAEAGWTEPSGAVVGTARYASPEQVRGESLDGRSDVYSLALLLVECVTGNVPFSADTTIGTLMARVDKPMEVPEALSALAPSVQAAGATDPADRPDAAGLVKRLIDTATELPRPTRLPIVIGDPTRQPEAGSANGDGDHTHVATASVPITVAVPGADQPAGHPHPGEDTTQRFVSPTSPVPSPAVADHHPVSPPPLPPVPRGGGDWWRRWTVRAAAAVLAIALGVAGAWVFLQASKPSHVVPEELIGATEAEINQHVGDFGWRIAVEEEASADVEAGRIVRTEPEPGSSLREGERLRVVVSSGPPMVDVPSSETLRGMTEAEATTVLTAEGIGLQPEFVPTPSNEVEEGQVIGLEEGTPEQLAVGSPVRVLVANGPAVTIPRLEGWRTDDARDRLEDLDLEVEIRREQSDDVDRGRVIRTEPGEGADVAPGTEVVLVIARSGGGDDGDDEGGGDQVEVPDLSGDSLDDAREALEDVGLQVGTVWGNGDGSVQFSIPGAGQTVDEGTQIALTMW
jgi:eukaryotic-like serine/threonine-protein kinase